MARGRSPPGTTPSSPSLSSRLPCLPPWHDWRNRRACNKFQCRAESAVGTRFAMRSKVHFKGDTMNWDRIEGSWKQLKGHLKEKWGKLTDDEFDQIGGKRGKPVGQIQDRYRCAEDEAERQVNDWETKQKM